MIRIIGILTGSAIAVSFLIIALGVPEFAAPGPADPDPVRQVIGETPNESVHLAELVVTEPDPEPDPADEAAPAEEVAPESEPVEELAALPEPPSDIAETPELLEQHWYAFWSPFRSELAANGFVSRLQGSTGLDYRVVRLKPGVYEVAFAYSDDADIQNKLAQITAATGLDMTGG